MRSLFYIAKCINFVSNDEKFLNTHLYNSFIRRDSFHANKITIDFDLLWILGIHSFDTEEELQQFFQRHKKNRDFAVIFAQDGSNGQLNYTIRTRNNNFRTEQIYLDNIYEIANRGEWINHRDLIFLKYFFRNLIKTVQFFVDIDEYIDSGFLALQRSIDKAYIELTTDQSRDEFKV